MDTIEKNNGSTPAPVTGAQGEEALKAKYGKLYRVGVTIPVDDDEEKEFSYYFKRPTVSSYDRFIQTTSKHGITKASRVFMLDAVVEEDRERLKADLEEYPGVGISIGNKLTEILGLTDSTNLKKL